MIRRHVLAALAAGIEAGDDDVARAALRRTDWVLRRRAKRRLEAALIDAALAVDEPGGADAESARHVQRVAALAVARAPQVEVTDRERVAAAYGALPVVRASRVPAATIIVIMLAACLATWGTPESYAGVLIVEGLSRHLGIRGIGAVIHDREIDRERLATLLVPMTTMTGDQLRTAARAVWSDLYDEPIVTIADR